MKHRTRHVSPWLALSALIALAGCNSGEDDTTPTGGGKLVITASAEELGLLGYSFPARAGAPAFGDGWELRFEKILVVIGEAHLSEQPDRSPTDASQVGRRVASLQGPFAVNLAAAGDRVGKGGGGERAFTLGELSGQNLNGDKPFDPEQRYAFGYDLVDATSSVTDFYGLEASDPDFAHMVEHGYTHLLVGTATFKGTSCSVSREGYDFDALPTEVTFRFGFESDVKMVNCQNPENTGAALGGEEFQRGIQVRQGAPVVTQITLHTDHLFWATVAHGAVPLFDPLAVRAQEVDGRYVVTLEDLEGAPLAPLTDHHGEPLPWRSCVSPSEYTLPTTPRDVTFETEGNEAVSDHHDFLIFNASTMAHLNQDGLCFVEGFEHSHDHNHDH